METKKEIELIETTIKNGERLTSEEAWKRMVKATKNNEKLTMVWKISNKKYQKWYDEKLLTWYKETKRPILTTIEDETTYLVHSGAKAFDSSKGGYSIFAISLGMLKREDFFSIDRIERLDCEWAIIIDLDEEE